RHPSPEQFLSSASRYSAGRDRATANHRLPDSIPAAQASPPCDPTSSAHAYAPDTTARAAVVSWLARTTPPREHRPPHKRHRPNARTHLPSSLFADGSPRRESQSADDAHPGTAKPAAPRPFSYSNLESLRFPVALPPHPLPLQLIPAPHPLHWRQSD